MVVISGPLRLIISQINEDSDYTASHPEIVKDTQGRLHASWYQAEPPDYRGTSVYYTNSSDNGESWKYPQQLGRRTLAERWASMPELALLPSGELHFVWVCGENAGRCHRWSKDGGNTWSATTREFGDMISLAGWDTMVIDGDGVLYWILQLREPGAVYYSYWDGENWSPLKVVNDGILAGGHYLRSTLHNGNIIDLVMVHQGEKEIWYLQGKTKAASIIPITITQPPPTADVVKTDPGLPKTEIQSVVETKTPLQQLPTITSPESPNQFIYIILLSFLIFFLVVIIIKFWISRIAIR